MLRTNRYWETERADILRTAKNTIRYYPNAEKLTIKAPDYFDNRECQLKPGANAALDLKALADSPEVAQRLVDILLECLPPLPVYIPPAGERIEEENIHG